MNIRKSLVHSCRNAFTLIEVILAIGITTFALLGIIGLFSTTLRTNKDSSAQQEGFEIQRILATKLRDTNQFNLTNNATFFGPLWKNGQSTNLFIYTSNNGGTMTTVLTSTVTTSFGLSNGTLYLVQLKAASNNAPTNIYQNASIGVAVSNWSAWPSLPVHATVYAIPNSTATNAAFLSNSVPVISYDLIIPK